MAAMIPTPPGSRLFWRGKHGLVPRILLGFSVEPGQRPLPVVIGPILVPVAETCASIVGAGVVSLRTGRTYDTTTVWDDAERDLPADETAPAPAVTGTVDFDSLDVLRTDKGFKKQSFWRFDGQGSAPFMFIVDAGDFIPEDPRVKKITRAVFEANRASEAVVPYDTLFAEGKAATEPVTLADAFAAAEEPPVDEADEDPADDLI